MGYIKKRSKKYYKETNIKKSSSSVSLHDFMDKKGWRRRNIWRICISHLSPVLLRRVGVDLVGVEGDDLAGGRVDHRRSTVIAEVIDALGLYSKGGRDRGGEDHGGHGDEEGGDGEELHFEYRYRVVGRYSFFCS